MLLDAVRGRPDHFVAEKAWTAGEEKFDGGGAGKIGHRGTYVLAGALVAISAIALMRTAKSSRS
jgi:hypothetical protein